MVVGSWEYQAAVTWAYNDSYSLIEASILHWISEAIAQHVLHISSRTSEEKCKQILPKMFRLQYRFPECEFIEKLIPRVHRVEGF